MWMIEQVLSNHFSHAECVCSEEVQAWAGCCSERRPVIISPEIAFIDIYCMI